MKKGIIVCVAHDASEEWNQDDETDFRNRLSEFDAVRIITPEIMPYQLHHIWLRLLSTGIMHIVVKMAIFNNSGKLVLTGEGFILPFIALN
ncbi:MAG: hypothetical protein DRH24_10930 [Deltaproteobacteria bacterium]|nr:hypothetical protein [Deltaproteobacteria bacterium]RLB80270.1 MAG: hypothetical protein DRH24_10930 [Deltaproteobacteria bacterium]